MSQRHPIIAITGSSGAGTTSVKRTFDQIFRREHINAAYVEGDSFPPLRPRRDEAGHGRSARARRPRDEPLRRGGEPVRRARRTVRRLRRERRGSGAQVPARRRRGRAVRAAPRHVHVVGGSAREHRPAVLRRAARRCEDGHGRRRAPRGSRDRRHPGDQPGSGSRSSTAIRSSGATRPRPSRRRSCGGCRTTSATSRRSSPVPT